VRAAIKHSRVSYIILYTMAMMMTCGRETTAIVIFFPGEKKIITKLRFILLFTLRNPTCTTIQRFQCFDWKNNTVVYTIQQLYTRISLPILYVWNACNGRDTTEVYTTQRLLDRVDCYYYYYEVRFGRN